MKDFAKRNLRLLGFDDQVDKVEQGLCPFCDEPIDTAAFRDEKSRKEYELSGMCQNCQNETFREK